MSERRYAGMPWWVFAVLALVSLVAIDVLDSDRAVVVVGAGVVLALGALSAALAVAAYRKR